MSRLEGILPGLIHKETGFIKKRQTQDSIRKVLHIMRQVVEQKTEIVILSLNAEKAFHSVSLSFLYKLLGKFGLSMPVNEIISGLYTNPTATMQ